MTKQEFEREVTIKANEFGIKANLPSDEEYYDIIEFVYCYHPAIRNKDGKEQIALLYLVGGIIVIKDMSQTATKAMNLEKEIATINQRLIELKHEYEKISKGKQNER